METSKKTATTPQKAAAQRAMDITRDNRAFVARGDKIELYSGNDLEGLTRAFTATTKDKEVFSPRKISLQDQSNKLLFLSPTKKNLIVYADTETGTPLHQVKVNLFGGIESPIKTFASETKYSGLDASNTVKLRTVGGNRLIDFEWDPRTKAEELTVTEEASSMIGGKEMFTDVQTTSGGSVAAVSTDGIVRLFSEVGKKAKTQLTQYSGTAATAVDTSSDGDWVVMTTEKYFVLYNVGFTTDKGEKTNGFLKPLGKNKKPGLVCKLTQKDLDQMKITEDDVHLTPARFDNGPSIKAEGVVERYIVTSTGNFTLQWNMRTLEADYKNLANGSDEPMKTTPKIWKQNDVVLTQLFDYNNNYGVVSALEGDLIRLNLGEK